jgi:hypothetical protein
MTASLRTPAPEGEAVAWRTVPLEPTEAMLVNGREALMPLHRLLSYGPLIGIWKDMLAASPVVPVGVIKAVLEAAQNIHNTAIIYEDEALLEDAQIVLAALRQPVVPVEVRRRVLDELDKAWLHGQQRTSWRRDESADAILAILRSTDTGRE